ncbi:hypothetical protein E2C01_065720 [Portunus trituberculatus]|uniref:Uncharacterized protein n=1 Tax=Portunus trituberculatus TaxID=210409 RepID=A0A5B7HMV0_PORTR|nr:hypothetical protein [Portunus trituberculatus]
MGPNMGTTINKIACATDGVEAGQRFPYILQRQHVTVEVRRWGDRDDGVVGGEQRLSLLLCYPICFTSDSPAYPNLVRAKSAEGVQSTLFLFYPMNSYPLLLSPKCPLITAGLKEEVSRALNPPSVMLRGRGSRELYSQYGSVKGD